MTFFNSTTPRLLVRKRSLASTSITLKSNSSNHSERTAIMPHRTLQFAAHDTVEEIDHVAPNEHENVWYPMDYLQAARKEEIKNNLRAQYFAKRPSDCADADHGPINIESSTQTWRGMEDILEKYNKKDKVFTHVQAVLAKYRDLKDPNCNKAQQSLRTFARALSKPDRQRAAKLGAQDAKTAHPDRRPRTPPSSSGMRPLSVFTKSLTHSVRRSLSPAASLLANNSSHHHSPSGARHSHAGGRGHRKTNSLDLFNWKFGCSGSSDVDLLSTRTVNSEDQDCGGGGAHGGGLVQRHSQ